MEHEEHSHHKDENKLNDTWSNLRLLTCTEHARHHTTKKNPMGNKRTRKKHAETMKSKTYREAQSKIMKKVSSDPIVYAARLKQIRGSNKQRSNTVKSYYDDPSYYLNYLRKWKGRSKKPHSLERIQELFSRRFPTLAFPENHKVVSIEYVGVQDVYDMEIEKYHNFAAQGIFVHNSEEDERGLQFIGKSGQLLEQALRDVGINMRRDCWLTNSIICRPPDNETPDNNKIEWCRPNLFNTLDQLQPNVILCFGAVAVKSLIGHIWKEDVGPMSRWAGFAIPNQRPNAWICPTYHPAYLLRQNDPVLDLHFREHLAQAVAKQDKPWKQVMDYEAQVQCVTDPSKAARKLRRMIKQRPEIVAVDYETNMLKPDSKEAEIWTCSVSDGTTTLAYPWHGAAIAATKELWMDAEIGKVASNLKFEERWTKKEFGEGAKNWIWDTMVAAHVLDNRQGITGLKFQSFMRLGMPSYDDHIKPYLHQKNSNKRNRIKIGREHV